MRRRESASSRARRHEDPRNEMTCHQANYSIGVGVPVDDQELGFEINSSITITFLPPENQRVTSVSPSPQSTPPSSYPLPGTTTDTITFHNPSGASIDFSVVVQHDVPSEAEHRPIGFEGPSTTVIFKPRTTCPT
jgi:hypothetical protein